MQKRQRHSHINAQHTDEEKYCEVAETRNCNGE